MLGNIVGESAAGYRLLYLPSKIKLVVRESVTIVIPPGSPTSKAETVAIPKGAEATLLSSDPICVSSADHGLRVGLLIRIDKVPDGGSGERLRLIERVVVVPVEALEIHPDEL